MDLDEIDFYENGEIIHIDKKILDDFTFTGLNNIDLITSGFYKTGWTDYKD